MELKPLRSEEQYEQALHIAARFFDYEPLPGTAEFDYFEVLMMLIESYEAKHFYRPVTDPIDAIKYRMELKGLTPKDLVPMIGKLNRVYEILNRSRPLTLPMIRRLHQQLGIPAESLIGNCHAKQSAQTAVS